MGKGKSFVETIFDIIEELQATPVEEYEKKADDMIKKSQVFNLSFAQIY